MLNNTNECAECMDGKYRRKFEIGARALNKRLRAAPSDMFDLLQETATVHSDSIGYDLEFFVKERKGWAILSWYGEFERLPKWRETVVVETWAHTVTRLVSGRNFRILDEDGGEIMKAVSRWVYIDQVRKRPVNLPGEMREAYESGIESPLSCDKFVLPPVNENNKIYDSTVIVRRSHTDSNFHLNNVFYIKWAEDGLTDDIFYDGKIKKLYVNYRKEIKLNESVNVLSYDAGGLGFVHYLKCGGDICAELLFEYC